MEPEQIDALLRRVADLEERVAQLEDFPKMLVERFNALGTTDSGGIAEQ